MATRHGRCKLDDRDVERRKLHYVSYMENLVDDDDFMNTWLEIRRRGRQSKSSPLLSSSSPMKQNDKSAIFLRSEEYENENSGITNADQKEIDPLTVLKPKRTSTDLSANDELDILAKALSKPRAKPDFLSKYNERSKKKAYSQGLIGAVESLQRNQSYSTYGTEQLSMDNESYVDSVNDDATFRSDYTDVSWLDAAKLVAKATASKAIQFGTACGIDDGIDFDELTYTDSMTEYSDHNSLRSFPNYGGHASVSEMADDSKRDNVNMNTMVQSFANSLSCSIDDGEEAEESVVYVNTVSARLNSQRSRPEVSGKAATGIALDQSTEAKDTKAEDVFRWTEELFAVEPDGNGDFQSKPVIFYPPSISQHQKTPPRKVLGAKSKIASSPESRKQMSITAVPSVPKLTHSSSDSNSTSSDSHGTPRSGGCTPREQVSSPPRWTVYVEKPSPAISTPPRSRLLRRNRDNQDHSTTYHYQGQGGWKAHERNPPQKEAKQLAWIQHLRKQAAQYK